MPEGINIRVTAVGAQQAAGDLKGVAAAEQQVAGAAKAAAAPVAETAGAQKNAADATRLHMGEGVKLLGVLRSMGPEGAIVADILGVLTSRMTGVGLVAGIAAAAVSILFKAVQSMAAAGEQEKRQLEEIRNALKSAADGYLGVAAAADEAAKAQGRITGQAGKYPEAAAARAAQIGTRVPLGKKGIETVAGAIAGGQKNPEAFADWVALGNAEGMDAGTASAAFDSAITADAGLPGKLRQQVEAWEAQAPRLTRQRRMEGFGAAAGATPQAAGQEILRQVADRETLAGRQRTPEQIAAYLGELTLFERLTPRQRREYWPGGNAPREGEMANLMGTYPELAEVPLDPTRYNVAGRGSRLGYPVAGPGAGQIIYGGTHVHNHGPDDPAGVPPPQRTGRTGR